MKFQVADYRKAVEEYETIWKATDACLYRLCADFPDHAEPQGVYAKLWLIGRSYTTGIERQIRTDDSQGSSMGQLGKHLIARRKDVDRIVTQSREVKEPLSPEALELATRCHGGMQRIVAQVTRKGLLPRSFVSKYLHFHSPAIPIYDSIASSAIKKFVRWTAELACFKTPSEADSEYAWYAQRFLRLYDVAREALRPESTPTVKHLDYFLLCQS